MFNLHWGTRIIRLIVLSRIDEHERNIPWELFSTRMERVRHGAEHYQSRHPKARDLLYNLYLRYQLELPDMAYTIDDFERESNQLVRSFIEKLPLKERLRGLKPEERLSGLKPEERLQGLNDEELQKLKEILQKLK